MSSKIEAKVSIQKGLLEQVPSPKPSRRRKHLKVPSLASNLLHRETILAILRMSLENSYLREWKRQAIKFLQLVDIDPNSTTWSRMSEERLVMVRSTNGKGWDSSRMLELRKLNLVRIQSYACAFSRP